MTVHHHDGDLPASVKFEGSVAIDTETMGLNPFRDALCVVQLSDGKGDAHVIRLRRPEYDCPNLKALVSNPRVLEDLPLRPFRPGHDPAMARRALLSGLLHQDRLAAGAHLHGSPFAEGDRARSCSISTCPRRSRVPTGGASQLSEAQLSYAAYDVHLPSRDQGEARRHAGARRAYGPGPGLLRFPPGPGGARPLGLGRTGHFCTLLSCESIRQPVYSGLTSPID